MKLRHGFVSNSSSSSFICDVCGETVEGRDISVDEAEMYQCENGHTFCFSEALKEPEDRKDEDGYEYDCVEASCCPICNFIEASNADLGRYLEKTTGITREEVFAEIKAVNKRRKKLRDYEYVETICIRTGTTKQDLLKAIKEKYLCYDQFLKDIR